MSVNCILNIWSLLQLFWKCQNWTQNCSRCRVGQISTRVQSVLLKPKSKASAVWYDRNCCSFIGSSPYQISSHPLITLQNHKSTIQAYMASTHHAGCFIHISAVHTILLLHTLNRIHKWDFYRTQVDLVRSMCLVCLSLSERCLWNFTDVTLADEDTDSIQTDKVNRTIQGNMAMQVLLIQVTPSGDQILN